MSSSLASLPAHQLLARMHELVRRGNAVEAELLAHLGEVDARRLYLEEGCSSMFHYCQRVLRFAEGVAYKRIQAARAARRFPELLAAVRQGELHVTGVSLLTPQLTESNSSELIRAARHRSADEIRRLLADREPRPQVPASARRLPDPAPPAWTAGSAPSVHLPAAKAVSGVAPVRWVPAPTPRTAPASPAPVVESPRAGTEPLGRERYAVRFTADGEVFGQIQELRALLRHQIPDGDLGKILALAVGDLLAKVRKRKFGECREARSPKPAAKPGNEPPSRHIPAAVRRAVAGRDGERCTYVSPSGRRCDAKEFLEFDHREPWARSKTHAIEGIRLRCRAHNQHAARGDFGDQHMARMSRRRGSQPDLDQVDENPVPPGVEQRFHRNAQTIP